MTTALTTIDYSSKEVIDTLVATVAQGLNKQEFSLFAEHCKGTGLNPFKKEVWAIKAGGRVQIMTGNQGFHTVANRHPEYDGIETGFVGKAGEYLPMTYPANDFIGAWAKVYRKDRRIAHEAVAMLAEYDKGQSSWKTMKRIMIVKCAESLALRKAFPQELNGLYTHEEMPSDYAQVIESESKPTVLANLKTADQLNSENEKIYHYDLAAYFKDLAPAKAQQARDRLEQKQGFILSGELWCVPEFIKGLEQYLIPKDSIETEAA